VKRAGSQVQAVEIMLGEGTVGFSKFMASRAGRAVDVCLFNVQVGQPLSGKAVRAI
jgi:hypothetical protein